MRLASFHTNKVNHLELYRLCAGIHNQYEFMTIAAPSGIEDTFSLVLSCFPRVYKCSKHMHVKPWCQDPYMSENMMSVSLGLCYLTQND